LISWATLATRTPSVAIFSFSQLALGVLEPRGGGQLGGTRTVLEVLVVVLDSRREA
jgi:hypothetical protein